MHSRARITGGEVVMRTLAAIAIVLAAARGASAAPKETVTHSAPTVTGALDAEAVAKVLTAGQARFVPCFQGQFAGLTKAINTTSVTFTIGKAGKVTAASTALDESIDICLLATIKKLAFPRAKPAATTDVTVVLRFERMPDQIDAIADVGLRDIPLPDPVFDGVVTRDGKIPRVQLGELSVKGALDKELVRRFVKQRHKHLAFCYERENLKTKGIAGTVTLAFTIEADGVVRAKASATGLANASILSCMTTVIRTIEFPKPKTGEVIVSYPVGVDAVEKAPAKGKVP